MQVTGPRAALAVRAAVLHPSLEVMNFLNEVVERYPEAVSFAPGRPRESLFHVESALDAGREWVAERARAHGVTERAAFDDLGQYGKTNGLIQEQIATHLRLDEGVDVPPSSLVVTSGCQEAMLVALLGLFDPAQDALLVSDPSYIGITGLARLLGISIEPVPGGEEGVEPDALEAAIGRAVAAGKRPRAFYDVPDFNNPLGSTMPVENRRRILEIARHRDLFVFEDGAYRMFSYTGSPPPTLKALDRDARVLFLGSFSKTVFPGLRLGFLTADAPSADVGRSRYLADDLSRVKSLTTVNTAPVLQSVLAGLLARHDGSLEPLVAEKRECYAANLRRMTERLEVELDRPGAASGVRWNRPRGGFFLTLSLPFRFDEACLEECAARYGVIVCPMSFFSLTGERQHQVRLSFSYVEGAEIDEGIRRFARFVRDRISR